MFEEKIYMKNREIGEILLSRTNEHNQFRLDYMSLESSYHNLCNERNSNSLKVRTLENAIGHLEQELINERMHNNLNNNRLSVPILRSDIEEERVRCVICNDNKTFKGVRGLNIHIGKMHKMNH